MKFPLGLHLEGPVSRAPQGARGLKSLFAGLCPAEVGRAPQGARGLKFKVLLRGNCPLDVAPRKGRVG